jgi:hypothetical protein
MLNCRNLVSINPNWSPSVAMGLGFKDRASVNHEGFGLAFWQN